MAVLDESRSRHVVCLKRFCGFSTQVRSGTCCRRAIRTTCGPAGRLVLRYKSVFTPSFASPPTAHKRPRAKARRAQPSSPTHSH